MTDLEQKVHDANVAYWQNNKPIMSDIDYDALVLQLKKEYPNSPVLNEIGGITGKYVHKVPMLSLNKAYTDEEVWAWIQSTPDGCDISVEPKYDGLAGKVENGRLVTRGNGKYGQDITYVAPIVKIIQIPYNERICMPFFLEKLSGDEPVLGEILISIDNFKKWFKSGKILQQDGSRYANPRNAVAGIVNRKDIEGLPDDLLYFCVYTPFCHYWKKNWSLDLVRSSIDRVSNSFNHQYPIDGVVFTLAPDKFNYEWMGFTSHHPRGAIAYKFGNNSREGIVAGVEWQQGREVLTPVLNLKERLDFDDVLVSKATLHNFDQFCIANLNVGDKVKIERAGDVIPKFVGVIEKGNGPRLEPPRECPCCGYKVSIQGKDLVCDSPVCRGKIVPRLVYASKCLRIDGIGPKTAQLLYEKLKITKLWQLLKFNYQSDIECLPGFTEYTAELLYKNIRNAVGTVYDWEVASACCVPGIGPELFKKWYAQGFMFDEEMSAELVGKLEGMSDTRAHILERFYYDNWEDINNMFVFFKPIDSYIKESKGTICCTGTADVPRSKLMEIIERAGYTFTDKMTADVKYLATNDLDRVSKKMEYAKSHGIPIVSYVRLYEMLGEQPT